MMKKLSFILVIIMLVALFSSCEGIGDSGLAVDSYAPEFEVSYEPLPKREYRRGEFFTITTCVTNISGKDLTYSAVINSYYPTVELHCQSEDGELSAIIKPFPIDTVSGSEEFTAKAGQVGRKNFTFIIPEDAAAGVYSITLNYRGNVCTYRDAIVILDKLPHIYCDYTVASGNSVIKPISVIIGYTYYKNEEPVFMEEIAGWEYIMSDSNYDPNEFPALVLEDGLTFEKPENVSHSSIKIYDTDFNSVEKLGDMNLLPPGEYVIVVIENVKTPADALHSVVGEYDYKLTKSALVFKLIVR